MFVEAHIIAWNESENIPFTIRHYQKFCDRIVIYDNYSDDNTREIAMSMGCDVRLFGIKGVLSDKEYLKIKNHVWKKSSADWVIVCDADEILWHENIKNIIESSKATMFKTYGWNVFSDRMPVSDFLEIKTGYFDENYSKSVIFKPKEIEGINYVYGCHVSNPTGNVIIDPTVLTLFHYRGIGGVSRIINRHKAYRKRMSEININLGLGSHYLHDDKRRIKEWSQSLQKSKEYSPDGFLP
jgi:glycosyltransferase involved in cell wall biosynthesis